jgi:hypothetical protein
MEMRAEGQPAAGEEPGANAGKQSYIRRVIAGEISRLSRYCDRVMQLQPLPHDGGELLELIDCNDKQRLAGTLPDLSDEEAVTLVLLNGNLNHSLDVCGLLTQIKQRLNRSSRVVAVAYNPYIR